MKAITLTQPWATLVAIGAKQIETRSWSTNYRGPLAIHAARKFPRWAKDICMTEPFLRILRRYRLAGDGWIADLPLGCILATCSLANIHRVDKFDWHSSQLGWQHGDAFWRASKEEKAFGDYSIGRYMWLLKDVVMLPEPIPAKGALSLWECGPTGMTQLAIEPTVVGSEAER